MLFTESDHQYMTLAIELAARGRFTTTPNPNVGCVIVKNNTILGQGWHKKAGTGHAEVNALVDLDIEQSSGATAYVTLEPCSHFGRTPPCARKLIEAGIKTVVIAMLDPNPLVAGKGVALLEQAGIKVKTGLLESQARQLNLGFLSRMEKNRPFISVKLASSLDGKTALKNGESKWITGPKARSDVQTFRAQSCAILSSAVSVIRDNAKLNVRSEQLNFDYPLDQYDGEIRQPIKIILDGKNRITAKSIAQLALFDGKTDVIIVRPSKSNDFSNVDYVTELVISYDDVDGFHLSELVSWCGANEINNLWIEAGGRLSASFIEQDLFDQLVVYIAPKIMGAGAQELLPIGPFESMVDVKELQVQSTMTVGSDLKVILSNTI
ncbi:bifunctional diaminohydroxyphosphoribosylaminopyrimidine deaminase/5-amino-6-(5-phosphoribosylamino)uracil reductase RibD [Psychrosphaera sp. 1_MG-2023]|uniref:bifunctional diaminohydroxyphosphoribosylaminopyrimidine deaminase/5-amino-6-(5-phosphoribosylamino)uracil reductase RibD n=1 Tax=Psychrosphaera sp. 1_MG-2023 TaxID=3062643 RepID=UPI0026E2AB79|nr:bifunctional diaminohydroxyphosphoribosylaminopyrimidine deaminase/5-amino-6-(5-phosphoribosylamino)uracil reductase RibD [Psychrosphaera sp. 1_MG-2023]MDO6718351.1 bifunctional diaminohydroxyphosphoribosylaminopyrimidine deaminase/5-amino-6-(5-phosphoribosylamino)uracil reductase RibD [Psychrosphaera sp. 1_MG-2023]